MANIFKKLIDVRFCARWIPERCTVGICFNPVTTGPDYVRLLLFHFFISTLNTMNMLNLKSDINQQYFKIVHLRFVKSEIFSPT